MPEAKGSSSKVTRCGADSSDLGQRNFVDFAEGLTDIEGSLPPGCSSHNQRGERQGRHTAYTSLHSHRWSSRFYLSWDPPGRKSY